MYRSILVASSIQSLGHLLDIFYLVIDKNYSLTTLLSHTSHSIMRKKDT